MYQSQDKLFTSRFEKHVANFMLECGLLKDGARFLVAVSGGIDSMALLHCLSRLPSYGYSTSLRGVHINHGTRAEQEDEAKLVEDYCKSLGVEFRGALLKDLDVHRNFEFEARKKRYKALEGFATSGELLALGHHIDDSFEWTILQNLRSSNLEGSLGIPVRNGAIIRPFMCVTKAQIQRYIAAYDLPYLEDPTNESTRHERNYIRQQIAEGFATRYPKYLKHYVYRQNELARRLGRHIQHKKHSDFKIALYQDAVELVSFQTEFDPSGLERKIIQALKHLLPEGRGSVSSQISKIIQAMKNNKSGPLSLAKGIKVYISFNHLLICSPRYARANEVAVDGEFQEMNYHGFKKALERLYIEGKGEGLWPLWVRVESKRFNFEASKSHALWPELFGENTRVNNLVPAVKLLRYWGKVKNQNKRLKLRLLLSL